MEKFHKGDQSGPTALLKLFPSLFPMANSKVRRLRQKLQSAQHNQKRHIRLHIVNNKYHFLRSSSMCDQIPIVSKTKVIRK